MKNQAARTAARPIRARRTSARFLIRLASSGSFGDRGFRCWASQPHMRQNKRSNRNTGDASVVPVLVTPLTQADTAAGQCRNGAHRFAILGLKTCNSEAAAGRAWRCRRRPPTVGISVHRVSIAQPRSALPSCAGQAVTPIRTKITFRPKRPPIGKPITLGHFSTASVKNAIPAASFRYDGFYPKTERFAGRWRRGMVARIGYCVTQRARSRGISRQSA